MAVYRSAITTISDSAIEWHGCGGSRDIYDLIEVRIWRRNGRRYWICIMGRKVLRPTDLGGLDE